MKKVTKLLAENKIRITKVRAEVLELFLISKIALSYNDLKKKLNSKYDKVTIYRTINKFLENKLIHEVPIPSGSQKYAFTETRDNNNECNHAHFICKKCGSIFCLNDVLLDNFQLPVKHKVSHITLTANGICDSCN